MARPLVSIVISAKNEEKCIERCLASLRAQKSRFPFEVHLVDNGSTDNTYALARKLVNALPKNAPPMFVWREKTPGTAGARGFGARKARGKVLLFTDADCTFAPGWVEGMARPLLSPNSYPLAAVGGRTESDFSESPSIWEKYSDEIFAFWEKDRVSEFPAFLPWAPTCNLAVKKDVFDLLGGFDPNWKTAAYDVDFCWRLMLCGFTLGQAPKAVVRHLRRGKARTFLRQMENYAYYNHSLLETYERALGFSRIKTRTERWQSQLRRTAQLLKETRDVKKLAFRGLGSLAQVSVLKGKLKARIKKVSPDTRLNPFRQGRTPEKALRLIPRGYQHLHKEGWCYWKSPSDAEVDGELILFRPKKKEWFRLNESAWRIWEVKSEGGQSEDAAVALGQSENDADVLRDIDELTLDLRTRRLLP